MKQLSKNIRTPKFRLGDIVKIVDNDNKLWFNYHNSRGIVAGIIDRRTIKETCNIDFEKNVNFNFIIKINDEKKNIIVNRNYCIQFLEYVGKLKCPEYLNIK